MRGEVRDGVYNGFDDADETLGDSGSNEAEKPTQNGMVALTNDNYGAASPETPNALSGEHAAALHVFGKIFVITSQIK